MSSLTDTLLSVPGPGVTEPIIELPTPEATGPSSQIDPTLPVYGNPTTQSVRQNFATAQVEITGLMQATQGAPFLALSGGRLKGPMYLYNDPTDVMMPVTLGYFNTHGGGGTGGGGIPEAPTDTNTYGRNQGAWIPVLPLDGGAANQMTGELLLAANPTDPLGAVPKQYADAIATTANAAVPLAGNVANPMTGLLILSGDPTAPLGAVTKQYADAGLALKANAANPTFTGIVTVASSGRVIVQGPTNPSLTLYNTTTGQPVFGIYNSGGFLGFGMAAPTTGNPNGAPYATMDPSGNFLFTTRVNCTGGRLISSLNGNYPSITINNTAQPNIFGFWNNNNLSWGIMDASGAPQTGLGSISSSGNMTLNGSAQLILGNTSVYLTNNGNWVYSPAGIWSGSFLKVGNQTVSDTGNGALFSGNLGVTGTLYVGTQTLIDNGTGVLFGGAVGIQGTLYVGNATLSDNSTALVIGSNRDLWFHSAKSQAGGVGIMYTNGVSYIGMRWDSGNLAMGFDVNGTWVGNITPVASDPRLKSNIAEPTVDALATISKLTMHQFDLTFPALGPGTDENEPPPAPKPQHWDIGFMSDELAELIPLSVIAATELNPYDSINQFPLLAYAFAAIQQLLKRIEALEGIRH